MPPLQVRTGPPSNVNGTDGQPYDLLGGKSAEAIVAELHGKYFTQNYRGNLFSASLSSASALVAPATNATPNFVLWNPAGNNVALAVARFSYGYVSGTPAAGTIGYSFLPYAGSNIGGTAAISAFTTLTIRSCTVGKSYTGNALAGSAATITGVAPSAAALLRYGGLSQGIIAAASVAAGMNMNEDFDGTLIVPPGFALYPVCSAASSATYMVSALWEEIPWP